MSTAKIQTVGFQLKRFGLQALCFWMVVYGPPLMALNQAAQESQAVAAREQAKEEAESRDQAEVARKIAEHEKATEERNRERAEANRKALKEQLLAEPQAPSASSTKAVAQEPKVQESKQTAAVLSAKAERPKPPSPPTYPASGSPSKRVLQRVHQAAKADLDTIPFIPSWNLLSIPETPTSTAPADVFSGIAGSYSKAWHYDACDPSADKWKVYDPANPAGSTLTSIDPTKGFWLDATSASALPSDGTLPTTTSWNLCTGWNLIGFPAGQNRHVRTALQTIDGKYSMVYGYDPTDFDDPWAIYDVTAPIWANDLNTFEVGQGYWILVTEDTTLEIPNQGAAPTAAFSVPADLSEITQPTDLLGTVTSPLLDYWSVSSRLIGQSDWQQLAIGYRPMATETVAHFDPTLLLNGLYELKLEAADVTGQIVEDRISVAVEGQMKIGHFTLSFVDLSIPLSGLDIQIVRTYDSRDKRLGDFGVGWTLDIRQGFYQNNRPPGDGWQIPATEGPWGLPCSVVQETKSHLTTIRLSDQEVYRFRLVLKRPGTIISGCIADAEFEWVDGPLPDTTLEILGNTEVLYQNSSDEVLDRNTFEPFVPNDVKLTTRDGRIFHLDLQDGVTHLEDLHGNTLEITPEGITHSSGRSVDFIRDADGKIEEIIDPRGKRNLYSYDGENDLIQHTDRIGAETTFSYRDHYLEDIHNAYGIRAVRTEFDDGGRMVKMIDASGKEMLFEHDLGNHREVITNRLGFTRVMEYDVRGNVTKEVNENGEPTFRTYDTEDNLKSEKNALGHTTNYEYTASNDLQSIKNALNHVTSFTYHALGLTETITDPLNHVTTNRYKANGELEWTRDALNHQTDFAYNGKGELDSVTDALNRVTSFEYDAYGNAEMETDALSHETSYAYDDHGNRQTSTATRTLPNGQTETLITRFQYDDLDRMVTATAADGSVTKTGYDLLGRVTRQTDQLGHTTMFEYDEQGRLTQTTYPDRTSTNSVFDAEGRALATVDPLGRVTRYTYDPAGRLLTTIYPGPDEPTTTNTYDEAGRLTKITDERGNPTRYVYDDAGRRTQVIDALGHERDFVYDDAGRMTSMTDARDHTTTYQYDNLGRLRFVVSHDQSKVETVYDALGRRTAVIDQEQKRTQFGYDALGRLTSVTDALNQITSYGYDEIGNFVRQTDANNHSTHFEYDSLGRQTSRILPDGANELFSYYKDGTLRQHVTFMGAVKKFTYDDMGRLLERRYPDGTTHAFTYTKTGRRATAKDHRNGVTSYEYDDLDRVIKKADPTGHSLGYAYDSAGNRITLTTNIGESSYTTSYTHDTLNRTETVTDPSNGLYTYRYNPNSQQEQLEHPNGVVTTWVYDSQDRLLDLVTKNSSDDVLQSYRYTMARTGHRTQIDEHDGTVRAYQYDDLWRLTQDKVTDIEGPVYQEDFRYDPVGNRLRSDLIQPTRPPEIDLYTYDVRDRIATQNGQRWQWDRGGRLKSQPPVWENPGKALRWWFDDRLLEVETTKGVTVETEYDVNDHRVRSIETAEGQTNSVGYLVDDSSGLSHVVADFDGDLAETLYVRSGDEILGLKQNGVEGRYYHLDGLGSVRGLTGSAGLTTETIEYSAFGRRTTESSQPYGFTGEPLSTEGLAYHRDRWLLSSTARMISEDPFMGIPNAPATLHRYGYAANDPINLVDPTGRFISFSGLNLAARIGVIIAGGILLGLYLRFATAALSRVFGVDRISLDFSSTSLSPEAISVTVDQMKQHYSRWKLDVVLAAAHTPRPGVRTRTVVFTDEDNLVFTLLGNGYYPALGRSAYVSVPGVRDVAGSGSPQKVGRALGNVATHEAAHSMGIIGRHHTGHGTTTTGEPTYEPFILQEGVAGESRPVRWSPSSLAWLDRVLERR